MVLIWITLFQSTFRVYFYYFLKNKTDNRPTGYFVMILLYSANLFWLISYRCCIVGVAVSPEKDS